TRWSTATARRTSCRTSTWRGPASSPPPAHRTRPTRSLHSRCAAPNISPRSGARSRVDFGRLFRSSCGEAVVGSAVTRPGAPTRGAPTGLRGNKHEDLAMTGPMIPRERADYSAIVDREPLKLPGGARVIFWSIVNYEVWDISRPMARQVLPAPTGVPLHPDVVHWAWHEYGMR